MTQIYRYVENNDSSTLNYKAFNENENNKYPTFSICINGENFYYNKFVDQLFLEFEMKPSEYGKIFEGEVGFKEEYNYSSTLYQKVSQDFKDIAHVNHSSMFLNLSDVLSGLDLVTQDSKHTHQYGRADQQNIKNNFPFKMTFQTPTSACFTRNANDQKMAIRSYDWISLKANVLMDQQFEYTGLELILHYPGQLVRSLHKPAFKSTFSGLFKGNNGEEPNLRELNILQVTVLKKRPDSNEPCNDEIIDDDTHFIQEMVKQIGCIPIYWSHFDLEDNDYRDCSSAADFKKANYYIEKYDDILNSYDPPCTDMKVLVGNQQTLPLKAPKEEIDIQLSYNERNYLEIENHRDFGMETFWTSVGGFIGLFLGYSLLQLPELFANISGCFIKKNSTKRTRRKKKTQE